MDRVRQSAAPAVLQGICYGVPLRLVAGSPELLAAATACLPYATELSSTPDSKAQSFTLLPPSGDAGFRSFTGSELSLEHPELSPVLEQLTRDLMVHVADFAPDRVFLHAGVVAWRGRALVLPGPSFAGKTTLVAALVRAGATYYSDEYAVIDPSGFIHPHARDLQMRRPAARGTPGSSTQRSVPVANLNGRAGTAPLRAAQVVFTEYQPGAHWDPQPVTPGRAVLEMLRHTIPVQRTPARVMATLTAMLTGASAWTSPRGQANLAAASILQRLDRQLEPSLEAAGFLNPLALAESQ